MLPVANPTFDSIHENLTPILLAAIGWKPSAIYQTRQSFIRPICPAEGSHAAPCRTRQARSLPPQSAHPCLALPSVLGIVAIERNRKTALSDHDSVPPHTLSIRGTREATARSETRKHSTHENRLCARLFCIIRNFTVTCKQKRTTF